MNNSNPYQNQSTYKFYDLATKPEDNQKEMLDLLGNHAKAIIDSLLYSRDPRIGPNLFGQLIQNRKGQVLRYLSNRVGMGSDSIIKPEKFFNLLLADCGSGLSSIEFLGFTKEEDSIARTILGRINFFLRAGKAVIDEDKYLKQLKSAQSKVDFQEPLFNTLAEHIKRLEMDMIIKRIKPLECTKSSNSYELSNILNDYNRDTVIDFFLTDGRSKMLFSRLFRTQNDKLILNILTWLSPIVDHKKLSEIFIDKEFDIVGFLTGGSEAVACAILDQLNRAIGISTTEEKRKYVQPLKNALGPKFWTINLNIKESIKKRLEQLEQEIRNEVEEAAQIEGQVNNNNNNPDLVLDNQIEGQLNDEFEGVVEPGEPGAIAVIEAQIEGEIADNDMEIEVAPPGGLSVKFGEPAKVVAPNFQRQREEVVSSALINNLRASNVAQQGSNKRVKDLANMFENMGLGKKP